MQSILNMASLYDDNDNEDDWSDSSDFSSVCGSLQSESSSAKVDDDVPMILLQATFAMRKRSCCHLLLPIASQPPLQKLRLAEDTATTTEKGELLTTSSTTRTVTTKPAETLRKMLGSAYKTTPSLELHQEFFFAPSAATIAGYDMEIATAVRQNDVATLEQLHSQGRNLQVGNTSGMSVIHTASRRGSYQVLEYLIRQAKVNPMVRCQVGRNPLHDACWSPDANLQVAGLLLDECPDFLYMTDSRGFTPLDYVHKSNWSAWNAFLQERGVDRLKPTTTTIKLL